MGDLNYKSFKPFIKFKSFMPCSDGLLTYRFALNLKRT